MTEVKAIKEPKEYKIAVQVAFNETGHVFATATVVGETTEFVPMGDVVERYTFTVQRPDFKGLN